MVFADPTFDLARLQIDRDYALPRRKLAPVIDSARLDLHAFAAPGGTLIQWHGGSVIAPRDSVTYFEAVEPAMGKTSCSTGCSWCPDAALRRWAWPSELPMTDAIEAWVEHGRAPDQILAPPTGRYVPTLHAQRREHSCI